jgi:hypothetical protein
MGSIIYKILNNDTLKSFITKNKIEPLTDTSLYEFLVYSIFFSSSADCTNLTLISSDVTLDNSNVEISSTSS